MTTKTYNGHKDYNYWNVSLWLGNDLALYEAARDAVMKANNNHREAARTLINHTLPPRTPDKVAYTNDNVMTALRSLFPN